MKLKVDTYRRTRGANSRLLDISCRKCGKHIGFCQKDGPGNLRQMYIDRIIRPTVPVSRKGLSCPNHHLLGVKITYEKERRPAYRLFVDAVSKKISSKNARV